MKYLVLGSEGQIGKPFCEYLRKLNHQVIGLDIKNGNHQDLRYNYYMNETHFKWADFVIFLAFDVGGSQYLKKYEHTKKFLDNNLNIMNTVFDLLEKYEKPFIFASSQMSNMTHSPYGMLKRIGEFYTRALNGINVQFWNVYGVETDPEKTHVITDFLKSAHKDKHIKMLTTGQELRQFLHVDDACSALTILSENESKLDKSCNYCVTSFVWNSIINVANVVCDLFGPYCNYSVSQQQDTIQNSFCNQPSLEILEYWKPKINLEDGIKKIAIEMGYIK